MPKFTNQENSNGCQHILSPAELGRLFREERKRQGLTLEELYSLTGLSIRFLSEFERGKASASLGRVMVALQALGLEMLIVPRSKFGAAQPAIPPKPTQENSP
ncbi:helix-turn-helix domain-containing protein [Desulfurispira natronophila]|uniref:Transcriptional regulator with XRE-family HTH domain n=1 Tax=Desulfurispira natronophila TaxID=682562 RepID=A0A7W8DGF3_9BACT|nr:helix-turn-helix domain-containing protein [Desulfurispira natronophila]MBB5021347.1 transcriptional regulator with XRE-family HTH domain [Desulfurispira natronophila]